LAVRAEEAVFVPLLLLRVFMAKIFTLQSPLDIVDLLIRQDDRSPRRERALNQMVFNNS
jgi:hypothetical protein